LKKHHLACCATENGVGLAAIGNRDQKMTPKCAQGPDDELRWISQQPFAKVVNLDKRLLSLIANSFRYGSLLNRTPGRLVDEAHRALNLCPTVGVIQPAIGSGVPGVTRALHHRANVTL
jgi:hypothetical protein